MPMTPAARRASSTSSRRWGLMTAVTRCTTDPPLTRCRFGFGWDGLFRSRSVGHVEPGARQRAEAGTLPELHVVGVRAVLVEVERSEEHTSELQSHSDL